MKMETAIFNATTAGGSCLTYDQIRQMMIAAQAQTVQNAGDAMITFAAAGMITGLLLGSLVVYIAAKKGWIS